jgi:exopolysaccharide production protein ExoY
MVSNSDEVLQQYLAAHPDARDEWERQRKLKNDPRITSVGSILRKMSLDELPQLVNVLYGEMSLVGPRPVVDQELVAKYGPYSTFYLKARPGITGPWQVSGRSEISYEQRVSLDADYVKNWSLAADMEILLRTIPVVLFARGSC